MSHDIRLADLAGQDAAVLVEEVQAEYDRRYGGGGDVSPIDAAEFRAPDGQFYLLYIDDQPAAMGGWRRGGPAGATDAELKRMYVRPQFARRGLARALLYAIEESAAAAGIDRMVLETGIRQPEAIALYRSSGYTDIAPFGFYIDSEDSVHLAKPISADAAIESAIR